MCKGLKNPLTRTLTEEEEEEVKRQICKLLQCFYKQVNMNYANC